MPLCKHAVLSLFISSSSKRQGQRVLYKYFKLNSSMLSQCFFSSPSVIRCLVNAISFPCAPTFAAKWVNFLRWIYLCPAFFAWRAMASLISAHVNLLFYPNLFSEERKQHRCKPTIAAFQFVIFLSPERGEENGGEMQQPLAVLTPNQVPLRSPSSRRSPSPSRPHCLPLACYSGLSVQSSGL